MWQFGLRSVVCYGSPFTLPHDNDIDGSTRGLQSLTSRGTESFAANSSEPDSLAGFFNAKGKCIQAINEALNGTDRATSDQMMWTLFHMIIVEAALGNHEAVRLHGAGLRGGLQSLPRGLQFTMSLTDVKVTYAFQSCPDLPPPAFERVNPSPNFDIHLLSTQPGSQIHRQGFRLLALATRGFDRELVRIFNDLCDIAQFQLYSSVNHASFTEEDASYFRYLTLSIEYELVTLSNRGSQAAERRLAKVEDSCLLACNMVINLIWYPWPRVLWIIPSLSKNLKAALGGSQALSSMIDDFGDVLSRILFLGSHCSEGQMLRPWHVLHLATCLSRLSLMSWEETREILVEFCTMKTPLERRSRKSSEAQVLNDGDSES